MYRAILSLICLGVLSGPTLGGPKKPLHDLLIRGGTIYDGSGGAPYSGDVVVDADRITYVGPSRADLARRVIDAAGKAVTPGFVNMLSQAGEDLLADGRAESDLYQGVTLEVIGEGESMGPLSEEMATRAVEREVDVKYPITWHSLGEYMEMLEHKGVSVNVASYVGAATVRINVLGERDVQPTPAQLSRMRTLVRQAMEEGAVGVSTALIYPPGSYAKTAELTALMSETARCGGIYASHLRSEGDQWLEALDEAIAIARDTGSAAEIFHLKAAGRQNWNKVPAAIERVNAARAAGTRITADMYSYTAAATGLDAAMPAWVQEGGLEAWIRRMQDPAVRARLIKEMQATPLAYESALASAGAEGTELLVLKSDKLKPLIGKSLAEVARMRGKSPEETAVELVMEDNSRVIVAYNLMSEDNVRKEVVLPWMSFGSDGDAMAPEGIFLKSATHPRSYGNFARVLARYVREERLVALPEIVRRLSALPATVLSLKDRGRLQAGYFADVVVLDPKAVQDHATFQDSQQLASGVQTVVVNGGIALEADKATGAHTGRFVRGRAWSGWPAGGCRASAKDWSWGS